eukprot:75765-Ditylum_brightwellii.AAC.1
MVVFTSRWTKHTIKQKTRQHMTISVEGSNTDQPDREATYMLPITGLKPKGSSLQQPDTFQDYINDLPVWEQQLFLHWKHITDHEELKTQIVLGKTLYYVTDGGADDRNRILWMGNCYRHQDHH